MIYRYIRSKWTNIAVFVFISTIFSTISVVFYYDFAAVIYSLAICTSGGIIMFTIGYFSFCHRSRTLMSLVNDFDTVSERLPPPASPTDEEYSKIIESLQGELKRREAVSYEKIAEMSDYYTVWAHQIKVPIAAMRLILQDEDMLDRRELTSELMRIDQYADMVMAYLRLNQETSDYVFRQCPLDRIISRALRKYASLFIRKKLTLSYVPSEYNVITDEKWLSFVIEQLISNAVKYTPSGGKIEIVTDDNMSLIIKDTGIGIGEEDLPRIFERGFTGINGRIDMRASGIGLYLCSRICKNLGYKISAKSEVGRGSEFAINLKRDECTLCD